MRAKLRPEEQMTVEEFLAFMETRPDEERWELIEGVAVMNASPTIWHQIIAGNVMVALGKLAERDRASWVPALGVGTLVPVSPKSLPQPDVMVFERLPSSGESSITEDAIVLFEVLSKSNTKADQAWRRRVYASIPNCRHYVTVMQSRVEVIRYDRSADWDGDELTSLDGALDLTALGKRASIRLADIYASTPLAARAGPRKR